MNYLIEEWGGKYQSQDKITSKREQLQREQGLRTSASSRSTKWDVA